ncbi:MAG TPA: carboxypeptidase-like regulatory domain-containing protein [Planctomycetota bacterium]|jgi:hypothetical protein|nr:carboxypeptidase-like regulatory domain-containing protein [Planctomycetota bacterium]
MSSRRTLLVALSIAAVAGGLLALALVPPEVRSGAESAREEVASTAPEKTPLPPPAPSIRDDARAPIAPPPARAAPAGNTPGTPSRPVAVERLRVRVLDPLDRPVEVAWVRAFSENDGLREVAYSAGGGDEISLLLPRGLPFRLEADSSAFRPGILEPVLGEQGEVTIVLQPEGGRVSGRIVTAESGTPIPRAALGYTVNWPGESSNLSGTAIPASAHEFTFYRTAAPVSEAGEFDVFVPPGTARFVARAAGREPADLRRTVREGDWLEGLELALSPERRSVLRIRVVDEDELPIRGARVDLSPLPNTDPLLGPLPNPDEVASDGHGGFRFESAVGEHWLLVSAPGFESAGPARASLSEGENEVEVVLARAARLRVRGVLPDGSATSGGQILLERSGRLVGCATSNGPVGSWTFHGRAAGARFEGARIAERAHPRTEEGSLPLLLDAEGFLALEGIAWGKYGVTVVADSFEGRGEVVVPPGETASVEVRLAERK